MTNSNCTSPSQIAIPASELVPVAHRPFNFNRRTYQWQQVGKQWDLTTIGEVVAQVVPDAVPGMYRVKIGDRAPSDMVNLTRAKDVALSLADRAVEKGRQRPRRTAQARETEAAGSPAPHPGEA
jgi:hypothetical protein